VKNECNSNIERIKLEKNEVNNPSELKKKIKKITSHKIKKKREDDSKNIPKNFMKAVCRYIKDN
jgi:hypothetical protein